MDFLFILELVFSLCGYFCAILILKRNFKYIGNLFFGFGYLCYAISGMLLFLSHLYPTPELILISVKSMVGLGAIGIGLLYIGTRIFFKGKFELTGKLTIFILIISCSITLFSYADPNSVLIISLDPVNSQLNLFLGIAILGWHIILGLFSINHLINVRKSAIEEGDNLCRQKINYIIAGFVLSIIGLTIYSIGNFGETSITDILFFTFSTVDLLCIFRGLTK